MLVAASACMPACMPAHQHGEVVAGGLLVIGEARVRAVVLLQLGGEGGVGALGHLQMGGFPVANLFLATVLDRERNKHGSLPRACPAAHHALLVQQREDAHAGGRPRLDQVHALLLQNATHAACAFQNRRRDAVQHRQRRKQEAAAKLKDGQP